ncbi:hypothetical protein ALC57_09202 [Trachymyrmex cornetzi]|uniref:GIY-YIG domain-containing protein n=1 Tax=Trachymyrmex cornetzi TaxID=471704 RepID=A0A195E0R1_9HYME|nr:hypothetical protein ALC57_09202 [Trachymyrmex cornetzi]
MSQQGVVYKISCYDCEVTYIGQTNRKLQTRVLEHRSDINKKSGSPSSQAIALLIIMIWINVRIQHRAHLEASARLKLKRAEFLTRARTSNDRDVIGRTRARKPRTSSFTWHAPGPGSEAAFREENFYRVARIERKRGSESSLLRVRRSHVIRPLEDSMLSPLMREIAAWWNAACHVNRAYFKFGGHVIVTII